MYCKRRCHRLWPFPQVALQQPVVALYLCYGTAKREQEIPFLLNLCKVCENGARFQKENNINTTPGAQTQRSCLLANSVCLVQCNMTVWLSPTKKKKRECWILVIQPRYGTAAAGSPCFVYLLFYTYYLYITCTDRTHSKQKGGCYPNICTVATLILRERLFWLQTRAVLTKKVIFNHLRICWAQYIVWSLTRFPGPTLPCDEDALVLVLVPQWAIGLVC